MCARWKISPADLDRLQASGKIRGWKDVTGNKESAKNALCTTAPAIKQPQERFFTGWNQEKCTVCIGIDSGVQTGLAIWNKTKQRFDILQTTTITRAMEIVRQYVLAGHTVTVYVEDARQRKWFGDNAEAKRQGAGSVKRDASTWQSFLAENKIPYEMKHPAKGMTKLTKEVFIKMTGYTGLSSVHSRDAAMLVYKM